MAKQYSNISLAGSCLIYIYVLIQTAWLCDDAFITFRTVDHFTNGYGLRWNIAERVQTYTHPLWMLLLSGFHFFTQEIFYTALVVSIGLSIAALFWVVHCASNAWHGSVLVIILLLSNAFVDYSTSGLENPLSYFLIGTFFYLSIRESPYQYQAFWLSLLFSFILLCRLDYCLLLGPAWVGMVWYQRSRSHYFMAILGLAPLVVWQLFSLLYYGFLFPNTAYAKLWCPDLSRWELINQGLFYCLNSLRLDTVTLLISFVTVSITLWSGTKLQRCFVYGILLYQFYTVWIGGDFMSGRFFATPFYLSVLVLSQSNILKKNIFRISLLIMCIICGLSVSRPAILSTSTYGKIQSDLVDEHQIYNERLHYYPLTGLMSSYPDKLNSERIATLKQNAETNFWELVVLNKIGLEGYLSARETFIVDYLGLGDALLARLPAQSLSPNEKLTIGHYPRLIPDGYINSILQNKNSIVQPDTKRLLDELWQITREPIFSFSRLQSIINMNCYSSPELNDGYYKNPPQMAVAVSDYQRDIESPVLWFHPQNKLFSKSGIVIEFDREHSQKEIQLWLDSYNSYDCAIHYTDQSTQNTILDPPATPNEYLFSHNIDIKEGNFIKFIELIPRTQIYRFSFGALKWT